MANSHLLMSCGLVVKTPEQKKWLEKYIPLIGCAEELFHADDDEDDEYPLLTELKEEAEKVGGLYLCDEIQECLYQDEPGPELSIEAEEGQEYLWVHSDEGIPTLSSLVSLLRIFYLKFDIDVPFAMQWAEICDRPRLDEFGGGAVVVSKNNAKWMSTGTWVKDVLNGEE